jgi:chromosome segregation ATPase
MARKKKAPSADVLRSPEGEVPTIEEIHAALSAFNELRWLSDAFAQLERVLTAASGSIRAKNQADVELGVLRQQIQDQRIELERVTELAKKGSAEYATQHAKESAALVKLRAEHDTEVASIERRIADATAASKKADEDALRISRQIQAEKEQLAEKLERAHQAQMGKHQDELDAITKRIAARRKSLQEIGRQALEAAEPVA